MLVYNGPVRANAEGLELYAHGSEAFPCGCYYNDPSVAEVPWHWHEELEFVFVDRGELAFLAAGERYVLKEGDAIFVNAGISHAETAIDGASALDGSLVCHPSILYGSQTSALWANYFSRLLSPSAPHAWVMRSDGTEPERQAASLVAQAHAALASNEEFFELTVRENLTRVCLLALKCADATPVTTVDTHATEAARVKDMVAFIERHFAEDITSADIARAGGVSEREMQREFRSTIGERPGSYLMSHRLFVASQLLKSTDASVGEVARRCGFASQSYFSKRFRERYDHAPREHRAIG